MLRAPLRKRSPTRYCQRDRQWPRRTHSLWAVNWNGEHMNPLVNKMPHEYKDIEHTRSSVSWKQRFNGEGAFSEWPWVNFQDDPVRGHKSEIPESRTISALAPAPTLGMPLWDHYSESSRDYMTPNDAPIAGLHPFLNVFVARIWTPDQVRSFLNLLREEGWETVEELQVSMSYVREWNAKFNQVPLGFIEHIDYLVNDIVRQNAKKEFRHKRQMEGDLRTLEMERYYAMPYFDGPAMPTTLEQPSGIEPTKSKITEWRLPGNTYHTDHIIQHQTPA